MLRKLFVIGFVHALVWGLGGSSYVQASSSIRNSLTTQLVDYDFDAITFPQPGDPWRPELWFIHAGDPRSTPLAVNDHQYFQAYGSDSEFTLMSEGQGDDEVDFVRLTLYPDSAPQNPQNYIGAEIAGCPTGICHVGDTVPDVNKKVSYTVRMRCGACDLDGNGHIGSWGHWAWKPYVQLNPDGSFASNDPITSMGFSWLQAGAALPGGMAMTVLKDGLPLYYSPIPEPVDPGEAAIYLQQWHEYRFDWRRLGGPHLGSDRVTFYIDDVQVGEYVIEGGMPSLTEEYWFDNQHPVSYDYETLSFSLVFDNPPEEQYVDLDSMRTTVH
jgi:hypothetical protein